MRWNPVFFTLIVWTLRCRGFKITCRHRTGARPWPVRSGESRGVGRSTRAPAIFDPDAALTAASALATDPVAFTTVHAAAIMVCFPATLIFETAAGFLFGLGQGALMVYAAKLGAGTATFFLARALRLLAEGRSRGGGDKIPPTAEKSRTELMERLASSSFPADLSKGMADDGLKYAFLARLSPLPSWVCNYGLALAGVAFVDYFLATAVASVAPIAVHVSAGAAAAAAAAAAGSATACSSVSCLRSSLDAGGTGGSDIMVVLGTLSSGILLQQAIERVLSSDALHSSGEWEPGKPEK